MSIQEELSEKTDNKDMTAAQFQTSRSQAAWNKLRFYCRALWDTIFVVLRNKRIDFYLIAPEKSGSTSLANLLGSHPKLTFGTTKESHIYRRSGKIPVFLLKLADRLSHVGYGAKRHATMFDATTSNSTNPFAARIIGDTGKRLNVIFLFRDPVERFVSQYRWDKRNSWTDANTLAEYLERCLDENVLSAQEKFYSASKKRPIVSDFDMQATSGNVAALLFGRYSDIFERYNHGDSLVLELNDLVDDFDQTVAKIGQFLNVDIEPFRSVGFPHSKKAPGSFDDPTAAQTTEFLTAYYRKHNKGLEELCGRRFSFSASAQD